MHRWIETYHVVLKWCSLGLHARPRHHCLVHLWECSRAVDAQRFLSTCEATPGTHGSRSAHNDTHWWVWPSLSLPRLGRMLLKLILTTKPSSPGNPANKTHVQTWGLVRSMQRFVMVDENSNLLMQLTGCRLVLQREILIPTKLLHHTLGQVVLDHIVEDHWSIGSPQHLLSLNMWGHVQPHTSALSYGSHWTCN
jgi:hypothetical protein